MELLFDAILQINEWFITPRPIRPKGIAIISVRRPSSVVHTLLTPYIFKVKHPTSTIHTPMHCSWLWALGPCQIFDHHLLFLKKNAFFTLKKKTLAWTDFEEGIELEPWNLVGWSHILGAPDYWKKIHGWVIFAKILAVFRKLDFTIFLKTLYLALIHTL